MSASLPARTNAPAQAPVAAPRLDTATGLWTSTEPWIAYGRMVLAGLGIALLLFSFVSINGAVVAPGVVMVESNTKTVQHLDGGIVAKILVKDGDLVHEGDVLVKLDDTQIQATLAVARGRMLDALTQQLRLEAERDGRTAFTLPEALTSQQADPQTVRMFEAQRALFVARQTGRLGQQNVLKERLAQLKNDFDGLTQQLQSRQRELEFVSRELAGVLPLYEKGYVNQGRVSPLQRDQARLQGEVGQLLTSVEKAKAAIAEAQLKLEQSGKDFNTQVAEELRKALSQFTEANETLAGLVDKLARTEIRAPRTGRVNALAVTTEGGVIAPGGAIAQVVPEDEKLIIEAKIAPTDIDKVRGGLTAAVKFPAFNAKSTPRLEGVVTQVSPATLTDTNQQNKPYFRVQVELPAGELAKLGRDHHLIPGMPAEVYIETRNRSILSYIVKPIADIVSRLGRDG